MHFAAVLKDDGFFSGRELRPEAPARSLRLARLRRDADVYLLTRAVARSRQVTLRRLLAAGRGTAESATARQLAMYLAHVLLGRSQDAVGALFGRDASTVSYACRVIEDLRDDPRLEDEINRIEGALKANPETRHAA